MTDHAIAALYQRRKEIAVQTKEAEQRVTKLRAALANLDAAIAILSPDHPDHIPPRRTPRRDSYFRRDELARMVRETLRDANKPLTAGEIAASILAAKGLPTSALLPVTKMVVARLGALTARGELVKSGKTRDARWKIREQDN